MRRTTGKEEALSKIKQASSRRAHTFRGVSKIKGPGMKLFSSGRRSKKGQKRVTVNLKGGQDQKKRTLGRSELLIVGKQSTL